MSEIIKPRILKGFRDFLPEQELNRKFITDKITKVFESFGFVPVDTPILEYTEVLLGKGSGETDKQIYRFTDNGKRDVSMRFDLTVPFARFMAQHVNELYLPFKRYHIAKVWRGENTQKGRYREFTQCDFDIVGADNAESDFEILTLMFESFKAIGISNVEFRISHRGIFNKLLSKLELTDKSVEILRTVDKLAKIGEEKVTEQLNEITSDSNKTKAILAYISAKGSFKETLSELENLSGGKSDESERLHTIYSYLEAAGMADMFILDPSITRGLDYYTGIVYETFFKDLKSIGSVCSGGRYNNLAGLYSKQQLPGVGSSIGLDRLVAALEELALLNKSNSTTDCIVLNFDSNYTSKYFEIASKLREAGFSVENYIGDNQKTAKQFTYAEKKSIPAAIICGEDEFNNGTYTIKNLNERKNYTAKNFGEMKEILEKILKNS